MVAEAVVIQIMKVESAQLVLSARYGFVSSMRAWPNWLQENARAGGARDIQTSNCMQQMSRGVNTWNI
jgi:hypothetical protein